MSKLFNFTFEIFDFKFNFGQLLPNNTWTGLIGSIASNVIKLKVKLKAIMLRGEHQALLG